MMMELATLNGSPADHALGTEEGPDFGSTREKLLEELEPLEDELRQIEEEILELTETARRLRRAIGGIKGLREPAAGRGVRPEGDLAVGFHGMAAMRVAMEMEPERLWSPLDLYEVLRQKGWLSPRSADPLGQVGNRMHRLLRRGELERVDRGLYRYLGTASGLPAGGVYGR
jgi:hypothetical protein